MLTIDDGTGLVYCFKYVSAVMLETTDPLKLADIGSVVIVQGTLQSLETNEIEYGLTLKVHTLFTSPDPNVELYHWTSCMLLDKEEYSRAAIAPVMEAPANGDQEETKGGACVCRGLSGDENVKVALPTLETRPGRRVKEELLYCPCASSKASLDPTGAFQVNLLFYILSSVEGYALSEATLLEDPAVCALAAAHLTSYLDRNVFGPDASVFRHGRREGGAQVPPENSQVTLLISDTLACFVRDGVAAPLTGPRGRGSHQLITKSFLRTALQSSIVSLIQQKRVFIDGDEAGCSKVTREEFDGELRDDPQLAPDAIDELSGSVPFIPKWRIQTIYDQAFNKV